MSPVAEVHACIYINTDITILLPIIICTLQM